ncbi:hypothetical protein Pelo_945 [Pelomyxa schiedti]|nr:hypothetical protein Pelo_945 [Pelomyxa schiedti]
MVVKSGDIRIKRVEFAPLGGDTLILYGTTEGGTMDAVVLVDLEATFTNKELVVKSKIVCGQSTGPTRYTRGVTWMPDGSPCMLVVSGFVPVHNYSLVDASALATTRWVFPKGKTVSTLQKTHVFAHWSSEDPNFQVFSNGNLAQPLLCVPCTWAVADQQSGLILSTSHQSNSQQNEMGFSLHEGVTGFLIGNFSVPIDVTRFKGSNLRPLDPKSNTLPLS